MKYSINYRQGKAMLQNADEIRVQKRDYRALPDIFVDYPDKDVVLDLTSFQDVEIAEQELINYNVLSRGKLILAIGGKNMSFFCKDNNIRFYFAYPVATFFDLNTVIDSGAEWAILDAPIFFDMNAVHRKKIKIRAIPNVAYAPIFGFRDGNHGTFIRPEDMHLYEKYVDICQFEDCSLQQERALYRIYALQRNWPGEMNLLISELDTDAANRMISPEFGKHRLNCGQRCERTGGCHICDQYILLANPTKIQDYLDTVNPN